MPYIFGPPVLTDWRAFVSWKIATLCGCWTQHLCLRAETSIMNQDLYIRKAQDRAHHAYKQSMKSVWSQLETVEQTYSEALFASLTVKHALQEAILVENGLWDMANMANGSKYSTIPSDGVLRLARLSSKIVKEMQGVEGCLFENCDVSWRLLVKTREAVERVREDARNNANNAYVDSRKEDIS